MPHPSCNESYASGQLPWDTEEPEPLLVEFVTAGGLTPSRTLEIGAGTGTNAIWLADRGFDVLAVDVSPLPVERAHAKLEGRALGCRSATLDVLTPPPPGGPFQFVFDRGCFHVFDEPGERQRFASQVAAAQAAGRRVAEFDWQHRRPPREVGPPVARSAPRNPLEFFRSWKAPFERYVPLSMRSRLPQQNKIETEP